MDSFGPLTDVPFTTHDVDNDNDPASNCAVLLHAGWWCDSGTTVNLNGRYTADISDNANIENIYWYGFRGYEPLKLIEMTVLLGEQ